MIKFYPLEAKVRIARLGIDAVTKFFDKVPKDSRADFFSGLPIRNGFRAKNPDELVRRINALIKVVSDENSTGAKNHRVEWNYVQSTWRIHSRGMQGGKFSKVIDEALNSSLSAAEFYDRILTTAGDDGICRNDMEELLQFGPFSNVENEIRKALTLPTSKQLEEKKKLEALPSAVADLKSNVLKIQAKLQEIAFWSDSAKTAIEHFGELPRRFDEISISIQDTRERQDNLSKKIEDFLNNYSELKSILSDVSQNSVNLDSKNKALQQEMENLSAQIFENEKRARIVEDDLKNRLTDLAKSKSTDELSNEVSQLKESILQMESLHHKVQISHTPPPVPIGEFVAPTSRAVNAWKIIDLKLHQISKPIAKFVEFVELLDKNYRAFGVESTHAKKISIIVTSALVCGQVVQFSGSLADPMLDATCVSIGTRYLNWDVPLGLYDSSQCEQIIKEIADNSDISSVVIRGANRSAFEIYADKVRRTVIGRSLMPAYQEKYFPILCSIVEGPGTMPPDPTLSQLGPVINTDDFRWHVRQGELKPGKKNFSDWSNLAERKNSDATSIISAAAKLPIYVNPLSRVLLEQVLEVMLSSSGLEWDAALEYLMLAWVAPHLRSGLLNNEEVANALAESMVEVHEKQSIKALLSLAV